MLPPHAPAAHRPHPRRRSPPACAHPHPPHSQRPARLRGPAAARAIRVARDSEAGDAPPHDAALWHTSSPPVRPLCSVCREKTSPPPGRRTAPSGTQRVRSIDGGQKQAGGNQVYCSAAAAPHTQGCSLTRCASLPPKTHPRPPLNRRPAPPPHARPARPHAALHINDGGGRRGGGTGARRRARQPPHVAAPTIARQPAACTAASPVTGVHWTRAAGRASRMHHGRVTARSQAAEPESRPPARPCRSACCFGHGLVTDQSQNTHGSVTYP